MKKVTCDNEVLSLSAFDELRHSREIMEIVTFGHWDPMDLEGGRFSEVNIRENKGARLREVDCTLPE